MLLGRDKMHSRQHQMQRLEDGRFPKRKVGKYSIGRVDCVHCSLELAKTGFDYGGTVSRRMRHHQYSGEGGQGGAEQQAEIL